MKTRILADRTQCVRKHSWGFLFHWQRLFVRQLPSQWSINTVKEVSLIFEEFLGLFNMLLFDGLSETGVFRHLSNRAFGSAYFKKYICYEGHLFFEDVPNLNQILKIKKKIEIFCFRDTYTWIRCVKLCLSRREYLPSALSVLGKSFEISHITDRDFL